MAETGHKARNTYCLVLCRNALLSPDLGHTFPRQEFSVAGHGNGYMSVDGSMQRKIRGVVRDKTMEVVRS